MSKEKLGISIGGGGKLNRICSASIRATVKLEVSLLSGMRFVLPREIRTTFQFYKI